MEEETAVAETGAATGIQDMNPEQIMAFVAEQGPGLAMQLITAILIFVIGRWIAKFITSLVRKALARTDMEDTLERFLCEQLRAGDIAAG